MQKKKKCFHKFFSYSFNILRIFLCSVMRVVLLERLLGDLIVGMYVINVELNFVLFCLFFSKKQPDS